MRAKSKKSANRSRDTRNFSCKIGKTEISGDACDKNLIRIAYFNTIMYWVSKMCWQIPVAWILINESDSIKKIATLLKLIKR